MISPRSHAARSLRPRQYTRSTLSISSTSTFSSDDDESDSSSEADLASSSSSGSDGSWERVEELPEGSEDLASPSGSSRGDDVDEEEDEPVTPVQATMTPASAARLAAFQSLHDKLEKRLAAQQQPAVAPTPTRQGLVFAGGNVNTKRDEKKVLGLKAAVGSYRRRTSASGSLLVAPSNLTPGTALKSRPSFSTYPPPRPRSTTVHRRVVSDIGSPPTSPRPCVAIPASTSLPTFEQIRTWCAQRKAAAAAASSSEEEDPNGQQRSASAPPLFVTSPSGTDHSFLSLVTSPPLPSSPKSPSRRSTDPSPAVHVGGNQARVGTRDESGAREQRRQRLLGSLALAHQRRQATHPVPVSVAAAVACA